MKKMIVAPIFQIQLHNKVLEVSKFAKCNAGMDLAHLIMLNNEMIKNYPDEFK